MNNINVLNVISSVRGSSKIQIALKQIIAQKVEIREEYSKTEYNYNAPHINALHVHVSLYSNNRQIKSEVRSLMSFRASHFRYFEGEEPVLVISKPEHIKQIAIKEFHKFHSHRVQFVCFLVFNILKFFYTVCDVINHEIVF